MQQRRSPILLRDLMRKRKDRAWQAILQERMKLPIMADDRHRRLVKAIDDCDVLIVPGSTGSGKSTQVPQIIFDYAIHEGKGGYTNIICSQPRRISAISVARRVATERAELVGRSVGHHVRFDYNPPPREGGILYCTGGILWSMLHRRPNDLMENVSHVLVDEVHERSTEIDLILMTLRKLIHQRRANNLKFPKVLLMSATLNSEAFQKYFSETIDGDPGLRTAVFEVPGRLYPVEEEYLDTLLPKLHALQVPAVEALMSSSDTQQYVQNELEVGSTDPAPAVQENKTYFVPPELVAAAIIQVFSTTATGDILAFLPGIVDIAKTERLLQVQQELLDKHPRCAGVKIFKLHSSLNETNDAVFDPIEPGWRRIVLASNIAETSITLPDVTHVIDTGTVKVLFHDASNESQELRSQWTNKNSLQQRRGRAGRVAPGKYFALYARARLDMFDESISPEIQRIDLASDALSLRTMAEPMDIRTALSQVPDPPREEDVLGAIKRLQRLGALADKEEVTPLGRALSIFAASPASAKAFLLGVLFRCLEPMLIAGIIEAEPMDHRVTDGSSLLKSRYHFAKGSGSNAIAAINGFKELHQAIRDGDAEKEAQLATERGLRRDIYEFFGRSARQICDQLHSNGFADFKELGQDGFPQIPAELNENADNIPLIKTLLMLSTEPELAIRWSKHTFFGNQGLMIPAFRTVNDFVSNEMIRSQIGARVSQRGDFAAYAHGRTTPDKQRLSMVESSMITPLMAILFARSVEKSGGTQLKLNGAIKVNVMVEDLPAPKQQQVVNLVMELRKMLDRFFQVAFSDLQIGDQGGKPVDCNSMFAPDNKLREKLVAGLAGILQKDAVRETEMLEQRYVVWEELDNMKQKRLAEQPSQKSKRRAEAANATAAVQSDSPYSEDAFSKVYV